MSSFVDSVGDEWSMRVTVGDVLRIRKEIGLDVTRILDDGMSVLATLHGDLEKFVGVLWCLCESQAESRGLTPHDFASRLSGDTLASAMAALEAAIVDFFPDPATRDAHKRVLEALRSRGKEMPTVAAEIATEAINGIDLVGLLRHGVPSGTAQES